MISASHFLRKLRLLLERRKFRDELNEEMEFHRAAAERAFVDDGMTPEAARHAAHRQLGNTTRLQEQSYEAIAFHAETLLQDLRYAVRQLRRSPAFTLTAILVLALGMGANLAIFAFVDAALIKPLSYRDPSRLVGLYEAISAGPKYCISYLDYLDWKHSNKSFQSMDVYTSWDFMLRSPEGSELAPGAHVSWGFFRTLGIAPMLGRDFLPEEEVGPGSSRSVILSYASWQKRFGGRRDILGKAVTLDGVAKTVVGIMPRDFRFAPVEAPEFWDTIDPAGSCSKRRICHDLFGIARLKDGITVENALDDLTALARRLEKQYPESNQGQGAAVFPLADVIVGDARPVLQMLLAASALLLLIAAVNVANLLLVRSESRRREIALREALGASRVRIVRQLITEGAVLVAAGSMLAVAIACIAVRTLPRLLPADMLAGMPFLSDAGLTAHIAMYATAIGLFAWTLFALVPLLRVPLREVRNALADGGRSVAGGAWRRFGSSLVALELATALLLLAGAGLLTRSLYRLLHVEIGVRTDHLATLNIAGSPSVYQTDAQAIALEKEIVRRMEALPGVRSAAVASFLPLSGNGPFCDFIVEGQAAQPGSHDEATRRVITPSYFATLGAQMVRGRTFTEDDGLKTHVAIVNQAMAQKFFAGQDPIGKRIKSIVGPGPAIEIIGIVRDIKEGPLNDATRPVFYRPFAENAAPFFSVVVRTSQDDASLLPTMVRVIHEMDSHIVVFGQSTMQTSIQQSQTAYLHRSAAWLAGGFACIALLLGVIGLYGVIAYSVSQRTREIGVRMALGAQRSTVYKLILTEAARLIAIGVGLGIAGSLATTNLLRPLLFGVRPVDLPTLASVAMILAAAALLASYLPARRAARVNPVEALRAE